MSALPPRFRSLQPEVAGWLRGGGDPLRSARRIQAVDAYPFLRAAGPRARTVRALLASGGAVASAIDRSDSLGRALSAGLGLSPWAIRRLQGSFAPALLGDPDGALAALGMLADPGRSPRDPQAWTKLMSMWRFAHQIQAMADGAECLGSHRDHITDPKWLVASVNEWDTVTRDGPPDVDIVSAAVADICALAVAPALATSGLSPRGAVANWRASKLDVSRPGFIRRMLMALDCPLAAAGTTLPIVESVGTAMLVQGRTAGEVWKLASGWNGSKSDRLGAIEKQFPCALVRHAVSWPSIAPGFTSPDGWSILPLDSTALLIEEGERHGHCAGTRSARCMTGRARLFSVRDPQGNRASTVELELPRSNSGQIRLSEHKGTDNACPPREAEGAVNAWLSSGGLDPARAIPVRPPAWVLESRAARTVADITGFGPSWDVDSREARERAWKAVAPLLPAAVQAKGPRLFASACIDMASAALESALPGTAKLSGNRTKWIRRR